MAGAVRLVREHTDRMDVLINNAGTPGGGVNPTDATAKDIHAVHDTNVYGPVRVTHAFLPLLQAADNPRVVMVTGEVANGRFTATDMNTHTGELTVTEGSDPIIELATLASDGPTGIFIDRLGPIAW